MKIESYFFSGEAASLIFKGPVGPHQSRSVSATEYLSRLSRLFKLLSFTALCSYTALAAQPSPTGCPRYVYRARIEIQTQGGSTLGEHLRL